MTIAQGRTGASSPVPPPPVRRPTVSPVVEAVVVLAASLALAAVITWPLVTELGTIAVDTVDAPFQAWTIDWVQHALTSDAPLWDANIYAPQTNTLAYSDSLIGVAVPFLPLRALGLDPLTQLNIAVVLGIATSAASAYLFARLTTRRVLVATVTGAAFAFGPLGTTLTAHLHTTMRAGIPLAAAAAWWLADRAQRQASPWAPATLLAGVLVWQMSVSVYPGVYAVLTALIVLAVRWRSFDRRGALGVAVTLAVTVVGVGVLAVPYVEVAQERQSTAETRASVEEFGIDFLAIDDRLVVFEGLIDHDTAGGAGFPGVTLVVLAGVGLVGGFRRDDRRQLVVASAVLLAVALVLAVGTAEDGWKAFSPYRLLFDHLPPVRTLRATFRAFMIGLFALAVLAGLGIEVIAGPFRRRRAWVFAAASIACAAFVVEGWAPWTDRPEVSVSAADRALAREERPGGVLYLPAHYGEGLVAAGTTFGQARNVYGTTAHHRRTPNGYSGLMPEEWPALSRRLERLPDPATLDELRELGVRFVVVRPQVRVTPWEDLRDPADAAPLELYGRFGDDVVYEVPDR